MDCSLPASSDRGTFPGKSTEWVVISFSRGSSYLRIKPGSPDLQAGSLPTEPECCGSIREHLEGCYSWNGEMEGENDRKWVRSIMGPWDLPECWEDKKRTRDRISVPTEGEESMEKAKEEVFSQERMRFRKEDMFMKSGEARGKWDNDGKLSFF